MDLRQEHLQYLKAVAEGDESVENWHTWWNAQQEALRNWLPVGHYFRLKYRGAAAASEILTLHGHPFTLPEPSELPEPEPVAEGSCPLCGGAITDQRTIGHWRTYTGGGGFWYGGKCRTCDVDFRLSRAGEWYLDAPDKAWLVDPMSAREINAVVEHLRSYPWFLAAWEEFIGRTRPGDSFWRYAVPGEGVLPAPVAQVRNDTPVGWFKPSTNLLLIDEPQAEAARLAAAEYEHARLQRRLQRSRSRKIV